MTRDELNKLTGADLLRRVVGNMNATREGFNHEFTAEQLIQIGKMLLLSEWDILPDRWTKRQVKEALAGTPPRWTDSGKPVYQKKGKAPRGS